MLGLFIMFLLIGLRWEFYYNRLPYFKLCVIFILPDLIDKSGVGVNVCKSCASQCCVV